MATRANLPKFQGNAGKFLQVGMDEEDAVWVSAEPSDAVQSVTDDGNGFVTVNNTDPQNPIIDFDYLSLATDPSFVTAIAEDSTFVSELIGNTTFTTDLANNTNFINTLSANSTFITNISGSVSVVTDGITITGDGTAMDPLIAHVTSGQDAIQFQDEGSDLGTPGTVDTVNFTGSGVTASRSSNTVTVNVPGGGGSGPTLETNGVSNGSQSLLNLVSGSNTTITDDGFGNITFASSGGGSGGGTIPTHGVDVTQASGTQTITHGLGQTPTVIKISAFGAVSAGFSGSVSQGIYTPAGNSCAYIAGVDGVSANSNSFGVFCIDRSSSTPTTGSTGVIQNVTSTSFDIVWTVLSGAGGANGFLEWEVSTDGGGVTVTNGSTTKNISDASGVQTITHGLGRIPSSVRIDALALNPITTGGTTPMFPVWSKSVYNGTTQSSLSSFSVFQSGSLDAVFTGSAFEIAGWDGVNGASSQTGVITYDATNIYITWTASTTHANANVYQLMWEAQ